MRLRHANWLKVTVAVAACVVLLAGDMALASNMGFKMNKQIGPLVNGLCQDCSNFTSLPYRHPYQNMQDVCVALGLSLANSGKIVVTNPESGVKTSWPCNPAGGTSPCLLNNQATCTALPLGGVAGSQPGFIKHAGLVITSTAAAGGILVGSHAGNPPDAIILKPNNPGEPKGDNFFSVPYHTTSANMAQVCLDLGLPGTLAVPNGKVIRRDPASGNSTSWPCGGSGSAPAIVLGEALKITFTGSDITLPIGHPAHF